MTKHTPLRKAGLVDEGLIVRGPDELVEGAGAGYGRAIPDGPRTHHHDHDIPYGWMK